ncbi:MAG: MltA domain-containing protein [Proteobacteria bacterium]|nr:MltA domain-containing protein [Pseudomonadota bacterium]
MKQRKPVRVCTFFLLSFLVLFALSLMGGCFFKGKEGPPPSLVRLKPDKYPRFTDDLFYDGIDQAIFQSLSYYNKMPLSKTYDFAGDSYDVGHLIRSLEFFLSYVESEPSEEDLNEFIRNKFAVYRSTGKDQTNEVLYTGYYEPSLRGSLEKTEIYRYPVYTHPKDLVAINLRLFSSEEAFRRTIIGRYTSENTVVPYYERSQIGNGDILKDQADILAYVDDKIDLFFLEIQGSGIIYLENGGFIRVHYHTKNGHPYRSIGSYLIRTGKVLKEEMSMQKIREYLTLHPDEVKGILNYNPSYVFFRPEEGGPYGCYGVEVTPERTIATDKRMFPACAISFINTEKPLINGDGEIVEWMPFGRFVLNQDTGGAIKGPGRADLFKGNGRYAEVSAGHMQHTGSLYFLVMNKDKEPENGALVQ